MSAVSLGGREYMVRPLPIRAASEWRAQFNARFSALTDLLANADRIELNSAEDIARVVAIARDVLLTAPDVLFDLLCAFAPEIAADRERIENEAYDDEVIAAFAEVLRLAFPFGALRQMMTGQPVRMT
jgi:hypothetical protein